MTIQSFPSKREQSGVITLPVSHNRSLLKSKPAVLFVDDDEALLNGLRLSQRTQFIVYTASSAKAAIRVLQADPGIAVVVADLGMPFMDGASFLALVRRRFPEVIRIVLSGQSDLGQAARAVNEGAIFRFVTKPCPADEMARMLADALECRTRGEVSSAASGMPGVQSPRAPAAVSRGWHPSICASCTVADLRDGMVLAEDLKTRDGLLLLPAGFVLTQATRRHVVERFRGALPGSVRVRIPTEDSRPIC